MAKIKTIYLNTTIAHYHESILEHLSEYEDIDLVLCIPSKPEVGPNVHSDLTKFNVRYITLQNSEVFGYSTLKGLLKFIENEKPDVIIVVIEYLHILFMNPRVLIYILKNKVKIVCKSIPFRMEKFEYRRCKIFASLFRRGGVEEKWRNFKLNYLVGKILYIIRLIKLYLFRYMVRAVSVHINYVDAVDIWRTYGVASNKIIKTGNASDSDLLLGIAESIKSYERPVDFRILHVGRLVSSKRVDLLIDAVSEIIKKGEKNIYLDIIGSGPEYDNLIERVVKNDVTQCVSFKGAVYDANRLGEFYKSASVCVLAGMGGLTIYEAMCFGLPVICSICDGTEQDLVTNGYNGFIFKENDKYDLIRCIELMMQDEKMLRKMSINSMNRIKKEYSTKSVAEKYHDAILLAHKSK